MLSKEKIQELMADPENDRVERTVSTIAIDKFGEAVCAFSNDISDRKQPGYLLIGVSDKTGEPTGLKAIDEVLRPGGLYGNARPENFPNVSDYRNLILAEAMRVMGFVNRFNRGIATAQTELTENGNSPAEFDINTLGVFGVTIREKTGVNDEEIGAKSDENGVKFGVKSDENIEKNNDKDDNDIISKKAQNKEKVLKLIKEKPEITNKEIAEILSMSDRNVRRIFADLVFEKLITREGARKIGFWIINENR